jgi:hypothetical protein
MATLNKSFKSSMDASRSWRPENDPINYGLESCGNYGHTIMFMEYKKNQRIIDYCAVIGLHVCMQGRERFGEMREHAIYDRNEETAHFERKIFKKKNITVGLIG